MMRIICRTPNVIIFISIIIVCLTGFGDSFGTGLSSEKAGTRSVNRGDLVTCSVSLRLSDGSLIYTTDGHAANNPETPKAAYYRSPACFQPITVVAGKSSSVPGLEECLPGMREGEARRFVLPPQKGFGVAGKDGSQVFPRIRTERRQMIITPRESVDMFGTIPKPGDFVQLNPYFSSRVTAVDSRQVEIENMAVDGARIEGPFGFTTLKVNGDSIEVILEPITGSTIDFDGRKGIIISSDKETFTVNFNHPLAVASLNLDIKVLKVIPAKEAAAKKIIWIEDYGRAFSVARADGKPLVLLLYASWCSFSRKFLAETLDDDSVHNLSDRFVWARVESDKNKDLMDRYGQKSFPLTLVLDAQGKELYRIKGAIDAFKLRSVLDCILSGGTINERMYAGDENEARANDCESGCTDKAGR